MTHVQVDIWERLYGEHWQGIATDACAEHPAKFSKRLIFHIVEHAIKEGWLVPGQSTVLDPFGGVGLGGLPSALRGVRWVGIELEPRFCDLAVGYDCDGSVEGHWQGDEVSPARDARHGWLIRNRLTAQYWGPAGEWVDGEPPAVFATREEAEQALAHQDIKGFSRHGEPITIYEYDHPATWEMTPIRWVITRQAPCKQSGVHAPHRVAGNLEVWQRKYGHLPQWVPPQLVQGDSRHLQDVLQAAVDCLCSSPPYAHGLGKEHTYADHAKRDKDSHRRIMTEKDIVAPYYGSHPAQLGNLPSGTLDCAVSSPPYGDRCANDNQRTLARDGLQQGHNEGDGATYGETPGQLSALPMTDLALSSPPYGDQQVGTGGEGRSGWRGYTDHGGGRAAQAAQLAAMPTGQGVEGVSEQEDAPRTFWEAAKQVLEQTFAVLKPGGHAIFVTKRYVRDGQIVEFSQDWARLCVAVGFEWVHHHKAMLVESHEEVGLFGAPVTMYRKASKGFFRRLAEQKGAPAIDWEDVLCFRKPLAATPMPPDDAWQQMDLDAALASPPYAGVGEILAKHNGIDYAKTTGTGQRLTPGRGMYPYSTNPDNLGNMPAGTPPEKPRDCVTEATWEVSHV